MGGNASLSKRSAGRHSAMKRTKEELIRIYLNRADEAFTMVRLAVDNGFWNSATGDLYYTCFYLVTALFIKDDIKAHTHSAVQSLFSLHYIKTGKLEREQGRLLNRLFDMRQEGNYGDLLVLTEEDILPLLNEVAEFRILIRNLLPQ